MFPAQNRRSGETCCLCWLLFLSDSICLSKDSEAFILRYDQYLGNNHNPGPRGTHRPPHCAQCGCTAVLRGQRFLVNTPTDKSLQTLLLQKPRRNLQLTRALQSPSHQSLSRENSQSQEFHPWKEA